MKEMFKLTLCPRDIIWCQLLNFYSDILQCKKDISGSDLDINISCGSVSELFQYNVQYFDKINNSIKATENVSKKYRCGLNTDLLNQSSKLIMEFIQRSSFKFHGY